MGKIIWCAGNITKEAFLFPRTSTKIYSIEELCYYIYNNIYTLSEGDFTTDLADWMDKELIMPVTSSKIKKMIRKGESLKDIVVTILCSADYYEEDEIKSLIHIMDQLEKCSSLERTKLRADNLLRYKDYKNAGIAYGSILKESKKETTSAIFIGNVLHNMGIVKMQSSSYIEACEWFQKAYEKNRNKDSYKAYILCLMFAKKDLSLLNESKLNGSELNESELNKSELYRSDKYEMNQNLVSDIIEEIYEKMVEATTSEEYQKMEQIKELFEAGKFDEFYGKIEQMIAKWKGEYKNGLI